MASIDRRGSTITIASPPSSVTRLLDGEEWRDPDGPSRPEFHGHRGRSEADDMPPMMDTAPAMLEMLDPTTRLIPVTLKRASAQVAILIDGAVVPFRNSNATTASLASGSDHMLATLKGVQGATGVPAIERDGTDVRKLWIEIFGNGGIGFSETRFDV